MRIACLFARCRCGAPAAAAAASSLLLLLLPPLLLLMLLRLDNLMIKITVIIIN